MAMLEATKAKDTFGDTLNRAAYGKERIILTRRGKPIAALVPLEDIALLNELENQADAEEVRVAREEAARGEVVAWEPKRTLPSTGFHPSVPHPSWDDRLAPSTAGARHPREAEAVGQAVTGLESHPYSAMASWRRRKTGASSSASSRRGSSTRSSR
jgi:prevent-host-death family protein